MIYVAPEHYKRMQEKLDELEGYFGPADKRNMYQRELVTVLDKKNNQEVRQSICLHTLHRARAHTDRHKRRHTHTHTHTHTQRERDSHTHTHTHRHTHTHTHTHTIII